MVDERFPARCRLQHQLDFQRVFKRKVSVSNSSIVVYACENPFEYTRLGLTVSRKYGNAVARHRWKRIVREVFRRQRQQLPTGLDLVVLPRIGQTLDYHQLHDCFPRLIKDAVRRLRSRSKKE